MSQDKVEEKPETILKAKIKEFVGEAAGADKLLALEGAKLMGFLDNTPEGQQLMMAIAINAVEQATLIEITAEQRQQTAQINDQMKQFIIAEAEKAADKTEATITNANQQAQKKQQLTAAKLAAGLRSPEHLNPNMESIIDNYTALKINSSRSDTPLIDNPKLTGNHQQRIQNAQIIKKLNNDPGLDPKIKAAAEKKLRQENLNNISPEEIKVLTILLDKAISKARTNPELASNNQLNKYLAKLCNKGLISKKDLIDFKKEYKDKPEARVDLIVKLKSDYPLEPAKSIPNTVSKGPDILKDLEQQLSDAKYHLNFLKKNSKPESVVDYQEVVNKIEEQIINQIQVEGQASLEQMDLDIEALKGHQQSYQESGVPKAGPDKNALAEQIQKLEQKRDLFKARHELTIAVKRENLAKAITENANIRVKNLNKEKAKPEQNPTSYYGYAKKQAHAFSLSARLFLAKRAVARSEENAKSASATVKDKVALAASARLKARPVTAPKPAVSMWQRLPSIKMNLGIRAMASRVAANFKSTPLQKAQADCDKALNSSRPMLKQRIINIRNVIRKKVGLKPLVKPIVAIGPIGLERDKQLKTELLSSHPVQIIKRAAEPVILDANAQDLIKDDPAVVGAQQQLTQAQGVLQDVKVKHQNASGLLSDKREPLRAATEQVTKQVKASKAANDKLEKLISNLPKPPGPAARLEVANHRVITAEFNHGNETVPAKKEELFKVVKAAKVEQQIAKQAFNAPITEDDDKQQKAIIDAVDELYKIDESDLDYALDAEQKAFNEYEEAAVNERVASNDLILAENAVQDAIENLNKEIKGVAPQFAQENLQTAQKDRDVELKNAGVKLPKRNYEPLVKLTPKVDPVPIIDLIPEEQESLKNNGKVNKAKKNRERKLEIVTEKKVALQAAQKKLEQPRQDFNEAVTNVSNKAIILAGAKTRLKEKQQVVKKAQVGVDKLSRNLVSARKTLQNRQASFAKAKLDEPKKSAALETAKSNLSQYSTDSNKVIEMQKGVLKAANAANLSFVPKMSSIISATFALRSSQFIVAAEKLRLSAVESMASSAHKGSKKTLESSINAVNTAEANVTQIAKDTQLAKGELNIEKNSLPEFQQKVDDAQSELNSALSNEADMQGTYHVALQQERVAENDLMVAQNAVQEATANYNQVVEVQLGQIEAKNAKKATPTPTPAPAPEPTPEPTPEPEPEPEPKKQAKTPKATNASPKQQAPINNQPPKPKTTQYNQPTTDPLSAGPAKVIADKMPDTEFKKTNVVGGGFKFEGITQPAIKGHIEPDGSGNINITVNDWADSLKSGKQDALAEAFANNITQNLDWDRVNLSTVGSNAIPVKQINLIVEQMQKVKPNIKVTVDNKPYNKKDFTPLPAPSAMGGKSPSQPSEPKPNEKLVEQIKAKIGELKSGVVVNVGGKDVNIVPGISEAAIIKLAAQAAIENLSSEQLNALDSSKVSIGQIIDTCLGGGAITVDEKAPLIAAIQTEVKSAIADKAPEKPPEPDASKTANDNEHDDEHGIGAAKRM